MAVDWSFMDEDEEPKAPTAPKAPKRSGWADLVEAISPRNAIGSLAAGVGDLADMLTAPNSFTNPNPQEGKAHRSIAGEVLTAAGAAPDPENPYSERARTKTGGKAPTSRVGRYVDSTLRGVGGAVAAGPGALTTAGVRALPKAIAVEAAAGATGGASGEAGYEVAGDKGRVIAGIAGGLGGGIAAARFIPPVKAKVTSPYGHRTAPKAGASTDHRGIDFRAPMGTPVQASAPGKVINRGSGGKSGNWVEVDYGNGVTSKYLHLQDSNVKVGQNINAGDVIARTGRSGNVTGPHLHWAVYKNGKPVDPMSVSFEGGGPRTPHGDVIDDVNDFLPSNAPRDNDGMIDDALDSTIARQSDVSAQEQEFAFQRAIADKSAAENLDHVELGAAYLRGDNPELVADIDARAQDVLTEMAPSPKNNGFQELKRDPDGTTHIEYRPSPDAEPIPIKMAIDDGVAEIAVDQFSTLANRLGPAKVREAMKELQEMYPEIKRFGGYRRSGAGKGRIQEIPVRKNLLTDERGTAKSGDDGEHLPSNVVNLASRRQFATVDDEIDYLDEVIAQGGPGADIAANRQDQLMAQQSAARHAAQESRKPPKAANDRARPTAEEMTDDPKLQAAIRAEDAYNEFVGWGDGPGVPMPSLRQRNARKAWDAKHDELWEAKENARKDNAPQSSADQELARRFDEFSTTSLKDPEFKASLEKIWNDAHEKALGPSGPQNNYAAASVRQRGGTGRNWPSEHFQAAVDAADEAVQSFWQGHVDRIKRLIADERGTSKASDDGEHIPTTPKASRAEEIKKIAETNNIDLAAARALYHSTPAGGGEAPPLPPRGGGGGDGGEGTPPPRDGGDDGSIPPDDGVDVVTKLTRALREAVSLRKKEDTGYSRARGRKFSDMAQVRQHTDGVEGFYSELGALRGELPHQDFSAIMEKFTQNDLDELFNMVKNNPRLGMLDTLTARKGLMKMMEGRVPTDNEIDLLSRVFPKSMIDDLMASRPMMKRFMEGASNTLNIPRALMASYDMSAPLRQGIFLAGRKQFYSSFAEMFKHISKQNHREITDAIIARPTYKLMQKAGLALADIDSPLLMKREEDFMSNIAEKVPGVRMSNQAYSGFLNTLRADVFDDILKHWNEIGFDYKQDPRTLKSLGKYINTATGRGDLGQFNQAVPFLNTMLFSPRLIASRVQLMNPVFYYKLDPMVRKQAFRDLLSFGGAANTILGLTSLAAGAGILGAATSVELDPRSTDFAKIKTGDTRMEFTGGFQPYIRLGSQLAAYAIGDTIGLKGHVKSSTTGKLTKLNTGKYGAPTVADKIGDFLASKESPVLSFLHEQFGRGGQNVVGEDVPLSKAMLERITPMFVGGAIDAYKEYGPAGLVTAPPSFFGVGVQTYAAKPKKEKASKKDDAWGFMDAPKEKSEKSDEWSFME